MCTSFKAAFCMSWETPYFYFDMWSDCRGNQATIRKKDMKLAQIWSFISCVDSLVTNKPINDKNIDERLKNKSKSAARTLKMFSCSKHAMTQELTTAIFKRNPVSILTKDSALDSVRSWPVFSFKACGIFSRRNEMFFTKYAKQVHSPEIN